MAAVPGRLAAIDALRGGAALAVVFYHALNFSAARPAAAWLDWLHVVVDRGYLGVPLFFVISGFCIHLRWASRHARTGTTTIDWGAFWKRRIWRLYPPYFVALCASMLMILGAWYQGRQVALVQLYPDPQLNWIGLDFLAHVTMLHGLHPLFDKAGGNPPFWSLAREEYLYGLYFFLLLLRRRTWVWSILAVATTTGVAFYVGMEAAIGTATPWWDTVQSSALVLWVQWVLGMVAVEAYIGLIRLPFFFRRGEWVPVWAAVAIGAETVVPALVSLLWGLSFFTLLNWCVSLEQRGRWPSVAMLAWLSRVGVFSYSLYLVHNPIRAVLSQLLRPLGWEHQAATYVLEAAVITTAGYAAGMLFFHVVERRFLHAGQPG